MENQLSQARAPIFEALRAFSKERVVPFDVPGHKHGKGNPELTEFIDDKYKYRVYVSVLTSISLDNHNWIPTTDNRLLRRIIRDYRFRGYSAEDTINRWPSVRRGEDKWIFPYQENADAMFNSAMLYELAALRKFAEPILAQVPESSKANAEAYRLLRLSLIHI